MKIIALTSHDGSGKSTIARVILAEYGGTLVPFAEAIRKDLIGMGFSVPAVRDKPTSEHMRSLMRAYGHALRTEYGPDHFIRRWQQAVTALGRDDQGGEHPAPFIVDDLHFVSEFIALDELGAMFISIESDYSEPDPREVHPQIVEQVWAVRSRLHSLCMTQVRANQENASRYQLRRRIRDTDPRPTLVALNLAHALDAYLKPVAAGPDLSVPPAQAGKTPADTGRGLTPSP